MCMCHSNGMFVFSARRKKRYYRQREDDKNGGRWEVAIVSKTLYWFFECCFTKYGCNEIIIVTMSCLAAITIGGIIACSTIYQLTQALTQRTIHMGQKTQGPCPIKVVLRRQ